MLWSTTDSLLQGRAPIAQILGVLMSHGSQLSPHLPVSLVPHPGLHRAVWSGISDVVNVESKLLATVHAAPFSLWTNHELWELLSILRCLRLAQSSVQDF